MLLSCVVSMGILPLAVDARGADDLVAAGSARIFLASGGVQGETKRHRQARLANRLCFLDPAEAQDAELLTLGGGWILMEGGLEGGPFRPTRRG